MQSIGGKNMPCKKPTDLRITNCFDQLRVPKWVSFKCAAENSGYIFIKKKHDQFCVFFRTGQNQVSTQFFYETKIGWILLPQTTPGFEVKTFDSFLKRRIALVDGGEHFKLILFGGMMDGEWYCRRFSALFFGEKKSSRYHFAYMKPNQNVNSHQKGMQMNYAKLSGRKTTSINAHP